MATINVNGQSVAVDDGFFRLAPDRQNATVDEIAKSLKPAAVTPIGDDRAATVANLRGIPIGGAYIDKGTAYLNALAAKIGIDPGEGMAKDGSISEMAGANEPIIKAAADKYEKDHPVETGIGKFAAGAGALAPLGAGAVGAKVLGAAGEALPALMTKGATAFGLLGGADAAARGENIGHGVATGVIGGAAGPIVGKGVELATKYVAAPLLSPIVNQYKARTNPQAFGEAQVARGIHESGIDPNELSRDVIQAGNEGQGGAYTLGDAMGNPGQRLLSTVARAPGPGRTDVVQAMDARQGDQGRRLAIALREGFDAPQTADATRSAMSANANFEAGRNYAPVRRDTTAIDVTDPVAIANQSISPAADSLSRAQGRLPTDLAARAPIEGQESALRDPIGQAMKEARSYLAAPTLTVSNVNQAFRAKTNLDAMIAKATEDGRGALVAELMPVRNALDDTLARTSSSYSSARDSYRVAQQRIEALDTGKTLGAKPVRSEDAIQQFNALPDAEAQRAFRVGYADPQIAQVQSGAFGTNKARPFTSDATKDEFNAFAAPGRADQLQRQIGREMTMAETRQAAMGGSKTVDNLNDHDAMAVDPHVVMGVVGNLMHGNIPTAMSRMLQAGANGFTGNTPAVRKVVSDILLQRAPQMNPQALETMVNQTVAKIQAMQTNISRLGQLASRSTAIETTGSGGRPVSP